MIRGKRPTVLHAVENGFTFISSEPALLGDVDGNGYLEIVDATWIRRYPAMMNVPYAIEEPIS